MTVVASADIQVNLQDAEYQRKKQAIERDLQDYRRPIQIALDLQRPSTIGSTSSGELDRVQFDNALARDRRAERRVRHIADLPGSITPYIPKPISTQPTQQAPVEVAPQFEVVAPQKSKFVSDLERAEKQAIADVRQLMKQREQDYQADIGIITDLRRRDIQERLGDERALQGELTSMVRSAALEREKFKRNSAQVDIDNAIALKFAKAELSQASELQKLSKLSQQPQNDFTRQEIERQVSELSGGKNLAELRLPGLNADQSLLVRRQQQEDVLAKSQAAALGAQLQQKQAALELDLKSEKISNARVVQEQRLALLKAQQNQLAAAQSYGDALYAATNPAFDATERDKAIARNRLANAGSNLDLATQGVAIANRGVIDAQSFDREFSASVVSALQAGLRQDNATKELFNLSNAARERQQSLELAQSGIDPLRYNNRRYEPFELSQRTGLMGDRSSARSLGALGDRGSVGIELGQLVTVNERMYLLNSQILYELQQIVNRPVPKVTPSTPVSYTPASVLKGRGL